MQALNLTAEDRDIIDKGAWLNDKILVAVNKIAAEHFHSTPCQTSLLAHDAGDFRSVRRGLQVLYATDYWVAAACDDDEVLVMANSLRDSTSPLVGKQLKQLYHHCVDANGK